jgi:protein-tyrosine phosphatase
MKPRPIEHCYWVIENKLLAGEYPRTKELASSKKKLSALVRAGVSLFVDLTEENELLSYSDMLKRYKGVSHLRFPIRDVSIPRSPKFTTAILDAIDAGMSNGGMVYVHCWGGVGRTGLVIGCWLSRHCGDGSAALISLRELWRHCAKSANRRSPETKEQERYVINWKEARQSR